MKVFAIILLGVLAVGCADKRPPSVTHSPSVTGAAGATASAARAVDRADAIAQSVQEKGAPPNSPDVRDLRNELAAAKKDLVVTLDELALLKNETTILVNGHKQVIARNERLQHDLEAATAGRGRWQGYAFALAGLCIVTLIGGAILGRFVRFPL